MFRSELFCSFCVCGNVSMADNYRGFCNQQRKVETFRVVSSDGLVFWGIFRGIIHQKENSSNGYSQQRLLDDKRIFFLLFYYSLYYVITSYHCLKYSILLWLIKKKSKVNITISFINHLL